MDVMIATGPNEMARHLATYIKDPSTIRAYVLNNFARAPSLDYIKAEIEKNNRPFSRDIEEPQPSDAEEFAPTFRANRVKPVKAKPKPEPIPEEIVERFLRLPEPTQKHVKPDGAAFLVDSVGEDFQLSPKSMRGPSRFKCMFHARSVVVKLLREQGWSYPRIGRALGGRDHSTVINSHAMFETYAQRDSRVLESYMRHRDMMDA